MAEEESEMEEGSEASSPTSDNLVTDAAPPPPPPPPSEIQTNLAEYAKFVADKLDTLFDTTTKIQVHTHKHTLSLSLFNTKPPLILSNPLFTIWKAWYTYLSLGLSFFLTFSLCASFLLVRILYGCNRII
jgi:hypothetical protein